MFNEIAIGNQNVLPVARRADPDRISAGDIVWYNGGLRRLVMRSGRHSNMLAFYPMTEEQQQEFFDDALAAYVDESLDLQADIALNGQGVL